MWQESILLVVTALLMAVIVKGLFLQAFYIPSPSMEPGLIKDDRILVEKISGWGGREPDRGDVIVFEDPGGWLGDEEKREGAVQLLLSKVGLYPTGGHLVKRVIGIAGDVITCCDDRGRLSVNGHVVDESEYVAPNATCAIPRLECRATIGPIPAGYVFVMGDNRDNSEDSSARVCRPDEMDCPATRGLVPVDDVVGKVFLLAWPFSRAHWVPGAGVFGGVPHALARK